MAIKRGNTGEVSTTTVVYSVTSGKTFYMTGYCLMVRNTSVSSSGRLDIADGTTTATIFSHVVGVAVAGSLAPSHAPTPSMDRTPIPFSVSVLFVPVSGTISGSLNVWGHEI